MWIMARELILITILIKLICGNQDFSLHHNNDEVGKAVAAIAALGLNQLKTNPSTDQFNNTINDDTVSSDPKEVKFYLYNNPQNISEYTELFINDTDTLTQSNIRGDLSLKVLTHGFLSGPANIYPQNVKNASLTKNETTGSQILIVGWSALSTIVNQQNPYNFIRAYRTAAVKNVRIVGTRLGEFLTFLINNNQASLDRLHFVGHSLGSHVSGVAGNFLKQQFGQPAARISGLDPAGPLFHSGSMGRPLSSEDAEFVDIIHTNDGFLGKMGQMGHADFHPEGGMMIQAGCRNVTSMNLMDQILSLATCSHSESHMLFTKSVGSMDMKGCRCQNYALYVAGWCSCGGWPGNEAVMGDNCDPSARGNYFLHVEPLV